MTQVPHAPASVGRAVSDLTSEWWRSGVVYQIWPRSFADGNGDGIGDLIGALGRLDHLKHLGVDAVWLSPIYPSPMVDGGYDVSDYTGIHPDFGTLADFDRFVERAHFLGIRVILDLVVNHSSSEHQWFRESRSSRSSDKRDWYFWRDPRPGRVGGTPGAEPNNWESRFGGSAWEWDESTGQYYLHVYDRTQPDLNWENPGVRQAVKDVMTFWLDRGADGFRLDVITKIAKHPDLPDVPVVGPNGLGDGWPFYLDLPRVHDHLKELRRDVLDGREPRPVMVGEAWAVSTQAARAYTSPRSRELDMVFHFDHVVLDRHGFHEPAPLAVGDLLDVLARWQTEMGGEGWTGLYLGNHDQPRALSRFGDDGQLRTRSATALATVLLMLQGTPFIYQGEEIGMGNPRGWSEDELRDVAALEHLRLGRAAGRTVQELLNEIGPTTRDSGRTTMRWDDSPHAGFTDGQPWIKGSGDSSDITVAAQRGRKGSVLEHYRRLIELRRSDPVVAFGAFSRIDVGAPAVLAFVRRGAEHDLLVLAQWGDDTVNVSAPGLSGWSAADIVIANHEDPPRIDADGTILLRAWEAVVLRRAG